MPDANPEARDLVHHQVQGYQGVYHRGQGSDAVRVEPPTERDALPCAVLARNKNWLTEDKLVIHFSDGFGSFFR